MTDRPARVSISGTRLILEAVRDLACAYRRWPLVAVLVVLGGPVASASAEPTRPPSEATATRAAVSMIRRLSPERRVGQLVLVPFYGSEISDDSPVARLIAEYGIGGVVISPERGNYVDGPDAPAQVARLANDLQARAAQGEVFIPLFVAIDQTGGIFPSQLLSGGMTPLPSAMALGATWRADLAEQVGLIVGRELRAIGVNLLFGPQLDVARTVRPGSSGDLGEKVFGGSPAWVSRMGRSYIAGVHRGSEGRVATVAGYLPGIGGSDRSQLEEAPVVESSLQQLIASDLVPFVASATAHDRVERSDAFATSLVRYRAVQQQPDRPFALDSGGLRYLWAQVAGLGAWRDAGGLLVSPPLGLPAVRRYVDPDLGEFNARRVLREMLVAGNDVLTLTNLGSPADAAAQMAEVELAVQWLAATYREDDAVREIVDAAVVRVLALKWRMYGEARLEEVLVDPTAAGGETGLGTETVAQVARAALTLVTPAGGTPVAAGPRSPKPGEQIAFVVDERHPARCLGCEAVLGLHAEAIVDEVRRTYGPAGTGRLRRESDVTAITFEDLKAWLQAEGYVQAADTAVLVPQPEAERLAAIEEALSNADWLVFAMRDLRTTESPASDALRLFLRSSPANLADRFLVALAFGAPYYLDTTEIAKLTAYYAVYADSQPFVSVAARALFGDEPAGGASPVSIPGVGYELEQRLQPALGQTLRLELVGGDAASPLPLGSTLRVRTTPILDGNGHLVPDDTPVAFRLYDRQEGVYLPDVRGVTREGRAQATLRAERNGEVEIQAVLDNGLRSEPLVLSIAGGRSAINQPLGPPELPEVLAPIRPQVAVDWGMLMLSLGLVLMVAAGVYTVDAGASRLPAHSLRLFLLSLAWGLAGYLLVAAGGLGLAALPGGARLWPSRLNPAYQAPLVSAALATLPLLPTFLRFVRTSASGVLSTDEDSPPS